MASDALSSSPGLHSVCLSVRLSSCTLTGSLWGVKMVSSVMKDRKKRVPLSSLVHRVQTTEKQKRERDCESNSVEGCRSEGAGRKKVRGGRKGISVNNTVTRPFNAGCPDKCVFQYSLLNCPSFHKIVPVSECLHRSHPDENTR